MGGPARVRRRIRVDRTPRRAADQVDGRPQIPELVKALLRTEVCQGSSIQKLTRGLNRVWRKLAVDMSEPITSEYPSIYAGFDHRYCPKPLFLHELMDIMNRRIDVNGDRIHVHDVAHKPPGRGFSHFGKQPVPPQHSDHPAALGDRHVAQSPAKRIDQGLIRTDPT